jgi:hypothetical protein
VHSHAGLLLAREEVIQVYVLCAVDMPLNHSLVAPSGWVLRLLCRSVHGVRHSRRPLLAGRVPILCTRGLNSPIVFLGRMHTVHLRLTNPGRWAKTSRGRTILGHRGDQVSHELCITGRIETAYPPGAGASDVPRGEIR